MQYGEPTPWDDWKRENENCESEFGFREFAVYRYQFTEGPQKGEPAFDLCGPHEDGSWTVEPADCDDIRFDSTDALIDFMLSLKLGPPLSSNT